MPSLESPYDKIKDMDRVPAQCPTDHPNSQGQWPSPQMTGEPPAGYPYVQQKQPSYVYQQPKSQTNETTPPPSHPLGDQVPPAPNVAPTSAPNFQEPINITQQQPYPYPVPFPHPRPVIGTEGWTTDLFGCLEDPNSAVVAFCFPCITAGQIAEILDDGHTSCSSAGLMYGVISLFGAWFLYSFGYRTKLRMKYNLVETPASDLLTHFLCEWCALAQEYRELRNKGLDPSLGWNGNMARRQQQATFVMTPPKPQMMI